MRLSPPTGRCCGKACHGEKDRFSQKLLCSAGRMSCFDISIRATGKNGESRTFHSMVVSSTGMFFCWTCGWIIKSKQTFLPELSCRLVSSYSTSLLSDHSHDPGTGAGSGGPQATGRALYLT